MGKNYKYSYFLTDNPPKFGDHDKFAYDQFKLLIFSNFVRLK